MLVSDSRLGNDQVVVGALLMHAQATISIHTPCHSVLVPWTQTTLCIYPTAQITLWLKHSVYDKHI